MGNQSRNRSAREKALTPTPVEELLFRADDIVQQQRQEEAIVLHMPPERTDYGRYGTFHLSALAPKPVPLAPHERAYAKRLIQQYLKAGLDKHAILAKVREALGR